MKNLFSDQEYNFPTENSFLSSVGFFVSFLLGIPLILGLVFKVSNIYMFRCILYAEVPSISHVSLLGPEVGFLEGPPSCSFQYSEHQAKCHHREHFVSSHLHSCVELHAITASLYFFLRVLAPSHLCWLLILVAIVTSTRQKMIHISGVI